jgi:hypothetical protein
MPCLLSFLCGGVCIHVFQFIEDSMKEVRLYILDPAHTQIISFPLFFLYIVEPLRVTKTEWKDTRTE